MKKSWIVATVLGLFSWNAGLANKPETTESLPPDSLSFDMTEVVVTATRTPLMLKETPVITRVISARDLEKQGVATIQQALENELAGAEFHQAGYGSTLSFQGLDARYVLFLVDGERMAGETYGNIDYARIPLQNIDRIEIVRGASSVLYGSNAMGAVINVITRMPKNRYEVRGSARYGTPYQNNGDETLADDTPAADLDRYRRKLDLINFKGDLSVGVNLGRFKSLSSFSYRMTDAYRLTGTENEIRHYDAMQVWGPQIVNGRPVMDPNTGMPVFELKQTLPDQTLEVEPDSRGLSVSGWRDYNIGQRFDYELSDKFRFEVSGNYFDKRRYDFNTSLLDENPLSGMMSSEPWSWESYQGYNAKVLMEHSPNANHKVYLSYIRDEYYRNLEELDGTRTRKQHHTFDTPRLLWTWNAGSWNRLTTGLEWVNEQLNFDLNPAGYDDRKGMNTTSLYVQDEMLTGRKLSFTLGLRGNYNNVFGWSVTPKVSAKYAVGKFDIRANYANGYRNPTMKELYMEFQVPILGNTYIMGNDQLKAEQNHYVSLSGEFTTDGFNASATMYHSFFRNKIDVRVRTEGDRTLLQYENIHHSQVGGLELMARVRIVRGLYLKGNYNYLYQTDEATDESTQYIFPSPHTATFQADYGFSLSRNFSMGVNASVRYTGSKDYEDMMTYLVYGNPNSPMPTAFYRGTYSAHMKGYAVCNAAVNLRYLDLLNLTLGVNNINNYRPGIVNFNSAITPRRHFFVQLAWNFGGN